MSIRRSAAWGRKPAEIERCEVRLKAINEARERLEQRQRDADRAICRSQRDRDGPPNSDSPPVDRLTFISCRFRQD